MTWAKIKGALAAIGGAVVAVALFALGLVLGRRKDPDKEDRAEDCPDEIEAKEEARREEILASPASTVVDSLAPETRGRLADAERAGLDAGRAAAREALHRL